MADQLKWLNTAILGDLVPKKFDANNASAFKIPDTHEECLFMAKLTEQAERFDEMVLCMRKIVKLNSELTQDERNLLAVAYKNVISSRRTAWRVISAIEQTEIERGAGQPTENLPTIVMLRKQFEQELGAACEDLLSLLDTFLIPGAQGGEPKVFYLKMKGDYHRYYAETAKGDQQKQLALEAYEKAMQVANASLAPTHPTRLGLVLNLSVFHYEIMKNRDTGYALARTAYDEAASELDSLEDEPYREAALIVQLLRDNINLWNDDNAQQQAQ